MLSANQSRKRKAVLLLLASICLLVPSFASAKKKSKASAKSPADKALADYLARVRAAAVEPPATTGSLWTPESRYNALAADDKAHAIGDTVTIFLTDTYSSSSDSSVKSQRTMSANSGISAILGNLGANNSLQNLFTPSSSVNLNGTGQSAVDSSLSVTLAGQVVDVLPNGKLVVEAARDMNVGNERQTIVVRGILRPEDISPLNFASSASLANLEVEVKGKGVVSDGSRPPNFIVRTLLHWLTF
jgi:flagellar L-ring protein FlgH